MNISLVYHGSYHQRVTADVTKIRGRVLIYNKGYDKNIILYTCMIYAYYSGYFKANRALAQM